MTEEMLLVMQQEIAKGIKLNVNGKIDALDRKIDEHNLRHEADMEEIKPFLQGAAGLSFLWKFCIALGALAVAYSQIKTFAP